MLMIGVIATGGAASHAQDRHADLWTTREAVPRSGPHRPTDVIPRASPSATRRESLTVTVTAVIDPDCPHSLSLLGDLAERRRHDPVLRVEILLATVPRRGDGRAAAWQAVLQVGLPMVWNPGRLRRLAPAALPAVWVLDPDGHGVRAAGRPPLAALIADVRAHAR
jgi:hypothetical protein